MIGPYQYYITGITSGQFLIPAGARSFTISSISGAAYVNGIAVPSSRDLQGGGYDGQWLLKTGINVGCTGGYTVISWESNLNDR